MSVIPAIIPESVAHITSSLALLQGVAKEVQIDIVDGVFVPKTSWPYEPEGAWVELSSVTEGLTLELDLMIESPETVLDECLASGAERFVIHIESSDEIETIISRLRGAGRTVGLALNNDTHIERVLLWCGRIDFVQCMGIAQIGVQGNTFDERVFSHIALIRNAYPGMEISVDGSVNAETLPRLKAAGVTRFVSGSAIFGAKNPKDAYENLVSLAS